MVAGVAGVGAVVAHHPQVAVGDGDRAEVGATADVGAGDRVDRVGRRVLDVGTVDLLTVDHDAGVTLKALDGLTTGGDHTLDQGVLVGCEDADVGQSGLDPTGDAVVGTLRDVLVVPGVRAGEDDDIPRLRVTAEAVGELVDEDAVTGAALTAVQRRLHRLRGDLVEASDEGVEQGQQRQGDDEDDRELDPPGVGPLLPASLLLRPPTCRDLLPLRQGSGGRCVCCGLRVAGVTGGSWEGIAGVGHGNDNISRLCQSPECDGGPAGSHRPPTAEPRPADVRCRDILPDGVRTEGARSKTG